MPSLSEIGDLSIITLCLVLPGFLMDTLLKRLGKLNGVLWQNFKLTSVLYNAGSVKLILVRGEIEGYPTTSLFTYHCYHNFFFGSFDPFHFASKILPYTPIKLIRTFSGHYVARKKINKQSNLTKLRNTQLHTFESIVLCWQPIFIH